MSKNYKLKSENYLKIEKLKSGYECSLFEETKRLVKSTIISKFELTDKEILSKVLENFNIPTDIAYQELEEEIIENIGNLVFKDKNSKIPMTKEELAEAYWDGDKEKIEKYGYDMSRLSGNLCNCSGNGRFVLEEINSSDGKIKEKQYMKCKKCGDYSHL